MSKSENIFDKLYEDKDLPELAKKDLLNNIDNFKFILEITDLFTTKMAEATMDVLTVVADHSKPRDLKESV